MFDRHRSTVGASPGTITLDEDAVAPRVRVVDYDAEHYEEQETVSRQAIAACRDSARSSWIHVQGLGDVDLVNTLGEPLPGERSDREK